MGAPAAAVADLLVIGELCVDLIIEVGDEIRFGQHEQIVPRTTLTMGSSSATTRSTTGSASSAVTRASAVDRTIAGPKSAIRSASEAATLSATSAQ